MAARIDFKKFGSEIPKDSEHMKYIETMGKALDAWKDENGERGFMIIACGENKSYDIPKDLDASKIASSTCGAFLFGGNRKNLASIIGMLMRGNKDFRNFLTLGAVHFTAKEVK